GMKSTIHLPLTLAITQSVLARAGTRQFAIPSAMVEHVLQYRPGEVLGLRAAGHLDWQGRRYALARLSVLVGERTPDPEAAMGNPAGATAAAAEVGPEADAGAHTGHENERRSVPVLLIKSGA